MEVSNPTSGCEVDELLLPYLKANVSTITEDGLNRTGRSCGCSVVSAPLGYILPQGPGHRPPPSSSYRAGRSRSCSSIGEDHDLFC